MEVYLVGGAVRDRLLGRPVHERDWVVVGADPQELVGLGYTPVGKEFPVFLHPETREEYALARLERKVAPGYHGFTTRFSPDVTLEQDLRRRDLTINAMAQTADGTIIDPFGGQRDLAARLLRHVSEAFVEDPVRILRVARLAARYAPAGFRVADETRALMRQMSASGEADALVAERVWQETSRALGEPRPDVFFEVLKDCGTLEVIFPEVAALFGVPQPVRWHPEVDTGLHILLALRVAAQLKTSTAVRFAVLTHDLGKAATPRERWPSHPGHGETGVPLIEKMSDRLKVPSALRELAILTARHHGTIRRGAELEPDDMLKLLEITDAFRRPDRFLELLAACEADARGRTGLDQQPYVQVAVWQRAREAAAAAVLTPQERQDLAGPAIAARLRQKRLAALAKLGDHAAGSQ
jgi:tRNA nucleotidyltransferase (CCA-adding enzyme)